jgi:hypothetical protein
MIKIEIKLARMSNSWKEIDRLECTVDDAKRFLDNLHNED